MQGLSTSMKQNWKQFLAWLSFACLIFGTKLWLIHFYGNATPFPDQWGVEATTVYQPLREGIFVWTDLFREHNRHCFFTTRLLALALFQFNGIWNPLFQMVVHSALHVATLGFCIALLAHVIGRDSLRSLLIFAVIFFSIPYGWENVLFALPPFYFVLLFGILCQWLTIMHEPLSLGWWGGVICGVLACLSLSAGPFSFTAAAAVGFLIYRWGRRKTRRQFFSVVILTGLFFSYLWCMPKIPVNASYKAASLSQFMDAFIQISAWPMAANFLFAFLRNFPALAFMGYMTWKRPPANDYRWFLLGMIFLGMGQSISIAYGRATCCLAPRYQDLFAMAVLVNFVCLIFLVRNTTLNQRRWPTIGILIWELIILVSFVPKAQTIFSQLNAKRAQSRAQELNVQYYLAAGDFILAEDKSFSNIPYPNPHRLAMILASPTICSILPSNIRRPLKFLSMEGQPFDAIVEDGYDPRVPKRTHRVWGSFGTQGALTTGEAWIRFDADPSRHLVAIPMAGYPFSREIGIEVEQEGRRRPLAIKRNLNGSWGMVYTTVGNGPFAIHVTDLSTKSWVAVGAPRAAGTLDSVTDWVIVHWFLFLLFGLGGGVILVAERGWKIYGILQTASRKNKIT